MIKPVLLCTLLLALCLPSAAEKHRLVILADMGNEPDEMQQMVHFLMYNNEVDLEGLIAVTGTFLQSNPRPDLFHKLVDAYEAVYPNLQKHASGWHHPDFLRALIKSGQSEYGTAAVGAGKNTAGSDLLIDVLTKDDPRPVYIVGNAGTNTLAQAIHDYRRNSTPEEFEQFISKIRMYENGAQDDAGAMILHENPGIFWVRSIQQTYCWGGDKEWDSPCREGDGPYTWEPYPKLTDGLVGPGQHAWAHEHIMTQHGVLGAQYPYRHGGDWPLEGGGTSPWIGLVNKGLYAPEQITWGGWGGRFTSERVENIESKWDDRIDEEQWMPYASFVEAVDTWLDPEDNYKEYKNEGVPIFRWRRATFNDFKARMDWCVQPYAKANHNPIAAFNGDSADTIIRLQLSPGTIQQLDASASTDPDGDSLDFKWWIYPEAGTYTGNLQIPNADSKKTEIEIPIDAEGQQIHCILEVSDRNPIVSMYDYRRVVIDVVEGFKEAQSPPDMRKKE